MNEYNEIAGQVRADRPPSMNDLRRVQGLVDAPTRDDRDNSPIGEKMDGLHRVTEQLISQVEQLAKKINPVLGPDYVEKEGLDNTTPSREASTLTDALETRINVLQSLVFRVGRLVDRVEL